MGMFGKKKPGTALVPQGPVKRVEPDPVPDPPEDAEFIWRCTSCGAMGIARESLHAHIGKVRRGKMCAAEGIKTYVPREEQEYEAKAAEVSASDTWVVIKLPDDTGEGEIAWYREGKENPWPTTVRESASGLKAIQDWYTDQIEALPGSATDDDREKCNGRYVALNFFTGHRAEALIESQWRANVEVAEGSHV